MGYEEIFYDEIKSFYSSFYHSSVSKNTVAVLSLMKIFLRSKG